MKRTMLVALGLAMGVLGGVRAGASEWMTDFAKASDLAKKEGKFMLLDFSGSDWCGWCMKLDKEVFSKSEFKEFAKQNLVLVLLDFPQSKPQTKKVKEQNQALQKQYSVRGYPTVIILTPDGATAAQTGYQEGGAKNYVDYLKGVLAKNKGASGGPDEKKTDTKKK